MPSKRKINFFLKKQIYSFFSFGLNLDALNENRGHRPRNSALHSKNNVSISTTKTTKLCTRGRESVYDEIAFAIN